MREIKYTYYAIRDANYAEFYTGHDKEPTSDVHKLLPFVVRATAQDRLDRMPEPEPNCAVRDWRVVKITTIVEQDV